MGIRLAIGVYNSLHRVLYEGAGMGPTLTPWC